MITMSQLIICSLFFILMTILQGSYYICFGDEDTEVLRGSQPLSSRTKIGTWSLWLQNVNSFHCPRMCPRLTIPTLLISAGTEGYVLLLLQNEAQNAHAHRNYISRGLVLLEANTYHYRSIMD